MSNPHLIYFADPMCSWCYGFYPVMEDVRRAFGRALPVRLVMGGLRPGTEIPMTDAAREEVAGHWRHVAEATGLPFSPDALARSGFVYDTDPAARAVVVLRDALPDQAVAFLARLQQAFYAEAMDVTDPEVLTRLAAAAGMDPGVFRAAWESEAARQATWRDYAISQRAGVTGFPTLVAGPNEDGVYGVVTRGYAPSDQVVGVLRDWLDRVSA